MDDEIAIVEKVSPAKAEAEGLLAQAEKAEITTMELCGTGGDLAAHLRTKRTDLDNSRKELVQPLNNHVKMINAKYNGVIAIYKDAEKVIKDKMGAFMAEEERRQEAEAAAARKKAEDEALARAAELQEAGETDTAEAVLDTVAEMADKAPARVQASGGYGAKASTRKTWTFDVVDLHAIPKEWLLVDEKKVKAAISAGTRDIPGLKIYQKTTVQVR